MPSQGSEEMKEVRDGLEQLFQNAAVSECSPDKGNAALPGQTNSHP